MKSTREKWHGSKYDFYLIAHEHLYVFRKPEENKSTIPRGSRHVRHLSIERAKFKESMRW